MIGFLEEGTARHGDFWRYGPHLYVVAGAELTRDVFRRSAGEFGTPPGMFPLPAHVRRTMRPGTILPADLERARRRFAHRALDDHVAMVAREAAALAASWPYDEPVAVLPVLQRTLSRIGARFCFGPDAGTLTHAEAGLARARATAPPRTMYLPRWVPTPTRRRLRRGFDRLAGRIDQAMRHRTPGHDGPDLLAAMVDAATRAGTAPGDHITYVLGVILVGAQEMPTRAAGWLLLHLARHPGWADRIADEAAALPADPAAITTAHVAALRHTDAFVRETLRLYPPNWLLRRVVTRPAELGGHRLVPGDHVLLSPYLLHRDARYHPDPAAFRPERWLDGTGTTGAYVPFGAGPRLCPGAALASLELALIVALTARSRRPVCPEPEPYRLTTDGALSPAGLRLTYRPR